MSLFSLRKNSLQPSDTDPVVNTPASSKSSAPANHPLDALTGGAFSAPTSGERAARVRDWLGSEPSLEQMNEVFKELSQRDRGASKPLKEKLDEHKRQKAQENIAADWAAKAQAMIDQPRLNLADAMAWQRDAARAGAPLSREPLAGMKAALAERVKAIEDLQHRVQVERESAVLMAQRIEVMSTKPWRDAQKTAPGLRNDVAAWQQQSSGLSEDPQWASVEAKFPPMLEGSRNQLQLVWDAFDAALAQAAAADADPKAALPAVPVWADELRVARGEPAAALAEKSERDSHAAQERRAQVVTEFDRAIAVLEREVAEGHGKATPKAAADVRNLVKSQGRVIGAEREARAHAALKQAGDLEDWQRWRADQLREELVGKAEALLQAPEGQRLGGRKMQETLRSLRDQWKTTDQGGLPNHALWKRFDEACTLAHKQVEAWLVQVRQQADAHKTQRLAIIDELNIWTQAHADNADWKAQIRELHAFSERWRGAGHLSEKLFAELQPIWKVAMSQAHAGLEKAQKESTARRRALIEEATVMGAAPQLRIDAVKDLQQRWQAEAHAVPLDRKHEQKLWEAFRQPIDEAFNRKSSERERAAGALNEHDQRVLEASKALDAATTSEDAQAIHAAMQGLDNALRGQAQARAIEVQEAKPEVKAPEVAAEVAPEAAAQAVVAEEAGELASDAQTPQDPADVPEVVAAPAAPAPIPKPAKKIVAVRGDDRPGMKKTEPAGRDDRRGPGRDARGGPGAGRGPGRGAPEAGRWGDRAEREDRGPMAPRLGDAAFRAQRNAVEHAEAALRKLAAQAHGEVLTQLLKAWEDRDAALLPTAQALGGRVNAATRGAWNQSLAGVATAMPSETLMRLEMAAEVPTPAEHLSARRMLQLQLLTRRNDPAPADTWAQDVAKVLAAGFDMAAAKRLQTVLKVLLKR
jgi:ATP-dependent RNA helicase SUPV3L1/SUV3